MADQFLDTTGLKCPQPVLKLAVKAPQMRPGEVLEISGDCPTFEHDVRIWCQRLGKVLLSVRKEAAATRIDIRF